MDEDKQSLGRLRGWDREVTVCDVLGARLAAEAEQRRKHCAERLKDNADQVSQGVRRP